MKIVGFAVGVIVLVLGHVKLGGGSPLPPLKPELRKLEPLHAQLETRMFAGKERAFAMGIGSGVSPLGIYVYDADGNCVVLDDQGNSATMDDFVVEWFPPETGLYTIELRNFGLYLNRCEFIMR